MIIVVSLQAGPLDLRARDVAKSGLKLELTDDDRLAIAAEDHAIPI
jgi:hypothetical protein